MRDAAKRRGQGTIFGSVLWVAGSRMIVRSLGVLSTLVLARLLTPDDFGVVAVAAGIIGLLQSFTDLGFDQALVHFQDTTPEDYATTWTLNALRGALLGVLLLLLAYPVAFFLHDQRLVPVLAFLSLQPIVTELANPRFIEFEKALQFNVVFRLMVLTKVVGVATTLTLAVIWHSYWALIVGMFATALARTFLTFALVPGRVWPELSSWRRLLSFSGWLSGAQMLGALGNRLDPLLLGVFATPQAVGFLHVARELTWTTFNEVAAPLRRVLFPALSRYESASPAFVASYRQAVAGLFMVLAPVSLGLALTAQDAVPLLLGPKWLPAVPPIRWIAIALVFSILGRIAESAAMAVGQTQMIFHRTLFVVPIKLTTFIGGAALYGLDGAVFGMICGMAAGAIINMRMGMKITGISAGRHITIAARSWVSLLGLTAVVLGVGWALGPASSLLGHGLRLVVAATAGAATYTGLHLICWQLAGRPVGPEATVLNAVMGRIPILKKHVPVGSETRG